MAACRGRARVGALLAAVLVLGGCAGGLAGLGPGGGPGASPGAPEQISVAALPDIAAAAPADAASGGGEGAGPGADPAPDTATATAPDTATATAPDTAPEEPDAAPSETPPVAAAPEPPAPPPLPVPTTVFGRAAQAEQAAQCTRRGGTLARRGAGDALACFITPGDAGRACSRDSDCAGACLARSRTCSPLIPLLGCHEVLLDNGARVTQCLE